MTFEPVNHIRIGLRFEETVIPVGRMAEQGQRIYFEFEDSFIDRGLEISPINCKLRPGAQTFDPNLFEGLPGVFNDSLPDGWGRLLLDRKMRQEGISPEQISPLGRLAHVGQGGMGALVYEPDCTTTTEPHPINLDKLKADSQQIIEGEAAQALQYLLGINGSCGGARPKAIIGVHSGNKRIMHGASELPNEYEPWIVKFPCNPDGPDAGAVEYVFALMAKEAGINMEDVHLFPAGPARKEPGFFATKRFDRSNGKRLHMHTAGGLLGSDFRLPSLDYEDLIALTMILTKDIREAERMFRLAVFNVLAHNRDDHAKNFSFLMNETGEWKLSPAYDLTFSEGPNGEQSSMVMGEGKIPGVAELYKLGQAADMAQQVMDDAIERTKSAIDGWQALAKEHGVSPERIDRITRKF